MTDSFRGDNAALIESIDSLLRLDAAGALVPHGVGGLARQLLAAAASRLAAAPTVPFCAPDGTCSCQKFADDPATCERRLEAAAQLAPGEAAPDLLQDLHNELYRAQRTESVEVLMDSIGKARLLLSRYRDSLALHAPAHHDAAAMAHVRGCFDAAEAEGLSVALAETPDARLKDLVERRLLHAVTPTPDTHSVTFTRVQVEDLQSIVHDGELPVGNRLEMVTSRLYLMLKGIEWRPGPRPEPGEAKALSDRAIEFGWRETFSTENPFCPCNLKSFTKAVRWAERAVAKGVAR